MSAREAKVSPELLRSVLEHDPEAGRMFWKPRSRETFKSQRGYTIWNKRFAGKEAFVTEQEGYFSGVVNYVRFRAHRVGWAIHYGNWPSMFLDHINGNPKDNRIANLREASQGVNMRNASMFGHNTSGFNGVFWDKRRSTWIAKIKMDRKNIHIGQFHDFEEACAARKAKERELGFHENHGRPKRILDALGAEIAEGGV